jgi:ribose 5-phosphate isomerase B
MKRIYLGADHRGFELKGKIKGWLEEWGKEYEDLGNKKYDKDDDYPDFASKVAKRVVEGKGKGILVCRSGTGVCIVANKYKGVRSILGFKVAQVRHGVEAEGANVLSLGAEYFTDKEIKEMIKVFLETKPSEAERHIRRRGKINKVEERGCIC